MKKFSPINYINPIKLRNIMKKFNEAKHISEFCKRAKKDIKEKIVISVSGGIDSTTSAALVKKSGAEYELLFINTGYMRKGEPEEVKNIFKKLGYKIKILDKKKEFYKKLENISDPIEKREAFRKKYFQIFIEYLEKNKIKYICQGTQFWKNKSKIYHNCPTEEFNRYNLKVIEPVKGLSKEEIRKIAKKLKVPEKIVNRKPFPGPGLLIRFGGKFDIGKLKLIKSATSIIDEITKKYKKDFKNCYQIFPYLCDGTNVTYIDQNEKGNLGNIILIRAIRKRIKNGKEEYIPFKINENISKEITKKLMSLKGIARVCFDFSPKLIQNSRIRSGATIEYI